MKTILVPTEQHDLMTATLETALVLARRVTGHIEGFALRQALTDFLVADPYGGMAMDVVKKNEEEEATQAKALFESFMQGKGIASADEPGGAMSCHWSEQDGDNVIGSFGRGFDVIVLGRPGLEPGDPHKFTFETALFESGRPILLAPRVAPSTIGDNILISWNASTEQTRTTAFSMPLLKQAKRVTVLTVEEGPPQGPPGELLARTLRFNGIPAKAVSVPSRTKGGGGQAVGETTLAYAASEGCDLLVKGAYTQSRLRQMIFGGATRHILETATLPVLMAH
jgi:nucleotide-binding universal stress UspA family protein